MTFDTFVRELDDQRGHANGSAKNGEWVPYHKRTGPAVRDVKVFELCEAILMRVLSLTQVNLC